MEFSREAQMATSVPRESILHCEPDSQLHAVGVGLCCQSGRRSIIEIPGQVLTEGTI